jgi:hypothetical protein
MKNLVVCVFLSFLIPGALPAQVIELGVFGGLEPHFGQPIMGSLSDTPYNNDTHLGHSRDVYGVRLTWNTKGYYGQEVGYSVQHLGFLTNYSTTLSDGTAFSAVLTDRVKVNQAFYNFLCYFMPRGERWRPFATAGGQYTEYDAPHFSEWPGGGYRGFGFNIGGGVKLKLFKHALMRLDLREYMGGRPYGQLQFTQNALPPGGLTHQVEATLGLSGSF